MKPLTLLSRPSSDALSPGNLAILIHELGGQTEDQTRFLHLITVGFEAGSL